MDKRRSTRARPKTVWENATTNTRSSVSSSSQGGQSSKRSSPGRTRSSVNSSPARPRQSPVRRSSRPRSTVLGSSAAAAVVSPPSPIKEDREEEVKGSSKTRSNLPTTLTTNTSSSAPNRQTTTSSVHSSYTSAQQQSNEGTDEGDLTRFSKYLRRSLSKAASNASAAPQERERTHTPTTINTESRYSRSISRSVYEDEKYSDTEQNAPEDVEEDEHYQSFNRTPSSLLCRQLEVPREFGGWLGALLLMLGAPCLVYYLQWCCTRAACVFKTPNLQGISVSYVTKQLFQGEAVAAYVAFTFGIFVLSGALFGKRVQLPLERDSAAFKFNVLPMALLLSVGFGVAEYLRYPVANFVLKHYLHFCIFGFINAFIAAIWSYLRVGDVRNYGTKVNVYGKTGNILVDYALGRQINPKWLGFIEFKQVYYRLSLLTTLLYAECFIYKNVQLPFLPESTQAPLDVVQFYLQNIKYDPAALLAASLLLFYVLDSVIFEHHLASSFELQGDGFGCLLLQRYAAQPYLLSCVAKYFYDRRTRIACSYAIYVSVLLLLLGLVVKRYSNAQKYKYRSDPTNAFFYGYPTVHTFQGRRLLLGALWGRLRQPNYVGDILAMSALVVPLFLRFAWPPLVCVSLCVVLLLHRMLRVNARNAARYQSSWARYCKQVPYAVVPWIY